MSEIITKNIESLFQWTPNPGLASHNGQLLTEKCDFFVAPPPEIGTVVSAKTTLMIGEKEISMSNRFIIAFVLFFITFVLLVSLPGLNFIMAFFVSVLSWYFIQFDKECSYIGEEGVAIYKLQGNRAARPKEKLFCFKDSTALYSKVVDHYISKNYGYVRYKTTEYRLCWYGHQSLKYEMKGRYRKKKDVVPIDDLWHVAKAIEQSWNCYLQKMVPGQIREKGYIEFPIRGNLKSVRVGPQFIEFVFSSSSSQRVSVEEITQSTFNKGKFKFAYHLKQNTKKSKQHSFEYSAIGNAYFFIICLEHIAGIKLDS